MTSTAQVLAAASTAGASAGLPMAGASVPAGFPSPADDWLEERLDLQSLVVLHPSCTFYVKACGDSMKEAGIFDGDILVVDRVLRATHGDIVIAVVDGELTVKTLYDRFGVCKLQAANPTYADIVLKEGQTLEIWGVVTATVKLLKKDLHVRAFGR